MLPVLLSLLLVAVTALWAVVTVRARRLSSMPGPGMLETFRMLAKDEFHVVLDKLYKKYGRVFRMWVGLRPMVIIQDPEMVKKVMLISRANYPKIPDARRLLSPFLGNGILVSEGEYWRKQRKRVMRFFQYGYLKKLTGVVSRQTDIFIEKCDEWVASGEQIELSSELIRLTMDVIGLAAFNCEVGALRDPECMLYKSMMTIFKELETRTFTLVPYADKLPLPRNFEFNRAVALVDKLIYKLMRERKDKPLPGDKVDLLDILMESKGDGTSTLTPKQIRDEMMTLLFAGHEATAVVIAWTMYCVSRNKGVEQKMVDEIREHIGDREPTFEELGRLKYMTNAIKEGMRMYAPVPMFGRATQESDVIAGHAVPGNTEIIISAFSLHRDPEYWEDADTFRPERWEEESSKEKTYLYVPFAAGPRVCAGERFAMMEAKIILVKLMRDYVFEYQGAGDVETHYNLTLRAKGGLPMKVRPRKV